MGFLVVIGFFIFFIGSFVVGGIGAWLAARITRIGFFWGILALLLIIPLQICYMEVLNAVIAFRNVEDGEAPYWDRYKTVVADGIVFWAKFGVMLGICMWITCLKQAHHYLNPPEEAKPVE